MFLLFIFLIPAICEIAEIYIRKEETIPGAIKIFMKINYMMMNLFTAKLFTPALNVLLNYYLDKYKRTALNSIFYIGVSLAVYFLNVGTKELMNFFFDDIIEIEDKHLYKGAKLDPGWAKVNIYNYLQYDENIYLDVDGICMKDLSPLFGQEKYYCTEVIDRGGKEDDINYAHWATNEKVWGYFKLEESSQFSSVQSSFAYIKKCKESKALFKKMVENFNFPLKDLKNTWGKSVPDELIISGTCAQVDHDPKIDSNVVFFGHTLSKKPLHELNELFYVNSLYGNGRGRTLVKEMYRKWYDRMCKNYASKMGVHPIQKNFQLMRSKHAG